MISIQETKSFIIAFQLIFSPQSELDNAERKVGKLVRRKTGIHRPRYGCYITTRTKKKEQDQPVLNFGIRAGLNSECEELLMIAQYSGEKTGNNHCFRMK